MAHKAFADYKLDILAVDGLEEPRMAETAIDNLVMVSSSKELIKTIARIYTESDQANRYSADFIHGKGEGQIILRHGPPGTGKTLTTGTYCDAGCTSHRLCEGLQALVLIAKLIASRIGSRVHETSLAQHYSS
jgi:hypothetical protein